MKIDDTAGRLTFTSDPARVGRVFMVVFALVSLGIWGALLFAALGPPPRASLDCARARGTCEIHVSRVPRSVALGDIERVQMVYRRGTRNRSASHGLELALRSGERVALSDDAYTDEVTAGFRSAAAGLTTFLATPTQPTYVVSYVSGNTDWVMLVIFALVSPLMFWAFRSITVARRAEIDRGARLVRVTTQAWLGRPQRRELAFAEVTGVRLSGSKVAEIALTTRAKPVVLMLVSNATMRRAEARKAAAQLASALAVPLDAADPYRGA